MPTNRFSSSLSPDIPHLAKGEIRDVRDDMYEALAAVAVEIDNQIVVDMVDAADVSGGGTTQTTGFQLKNRGGDNVAEAMLVEMGVFDDADFGTPAANATLNTATEGSIVAGGGSAALKVKTNATGGFACTLTDPSDETVYLTCAPTFGGPLLDCRDSDSVEFLA